MVTTGASEMAATAGTMPQSAQTGGDNSLFAQLLGGAVSDVAAIAPAAAPVASGKSGGGKAIGAKADAVLPAADMLALCGLPVADTAPAPVAPPTLEETVEPDEREAAAALRAWAGGESAERMAALQAPTPHSDSNPDANASADHALPAGNTGDARTADLRWLQGGVSELKTNAALPAAPARANAQAEPATQHASVAHFTTQAGQRNMAHNMAHEVEPLQTAARQQVIEQAAADPRTTAAERNIDPTPKQDMVSADIVNAEQQTDLRKPAPQSTPLAMSPIMPSVMSQISPMMNVLTAQPRDAGIEQSRDMAIADVQNPLSALQAAGLQSGGTQLARDASVLDLSPRHHLHASVGSRQWAAELGDKLTMLAARDAQSATLYMTPADMGPVQVRIELSQDQASVWFTAENAETRSALEQSLPKLREMFSAQGMSLTDAGVFGDRSRQQADGGLTTPRAHGFQYADEDVADTAAVRTISLGLLDAYA